MPLPYSYKNKVSAEAKNLRGKFPDGLAQLFRRRGDKITESSQNQVKIHTRNSLFNQEYEFTVNIETRGYENTFIYEINLEPLLRSSIFIATGSALFLFLSVSEFLIYGSLITVAYYLINFFFLNAHIQKNVDIYTGNKEYDSQEQAELMRNQKGWEKNPYKCTACGEDLTDIDLHCPECGIKVKHSTEHIPLNISRYEDMTIRYNYKDRKNKANSKPKK